MNWIRTRLLHLRVWWKYFWMSPAEREKVRAMQKLLGNLLAQAPLDKIARKESCTWDMTDDQKVGAMAGAQAYADAVKKEKSS